MVETTQVYNPQQVADYLKISVYTVIRYLKDKDPKSLQGFKVGSLWRIRGSEILSYLERIQNEQI